MSDGELTEEMFCDRSKWPRGPWDQEKDRYEWRDEATGLPCLIVRARGHLCGYAAVPPGHPLHGKDEGSISYESRVGDVHGGLTFSAACAGRVCHVAAPGEPDAVWWFGFDCSHYGDTAPDRIAMDRDLGMELSGGTYRTVGFVRDELAKLAQQLASATAADLRVEVES